MSLTHALPYDYDVVTRRVNQRAASLRNALLQVPLCLGSLVIVEPFAMSGDLMKPSWHTRGRLYGRGLRIVRYTRVEIEVHAWSPFASELRLRPLTRRVVNWGSRRQRRYFRTAHYVADGLVRSIENAARRRDAETMLRERRFVDQIARARRPELRLVEGS
jgi:hypothetical protein